MVSKRKSNRLMRKSSRRVMRKSNRKSRRGPSRMNLRSPLQVYRDYQKDKEDRKDIILKHLKRSNLLKHRKPDEIKRDDKLKRSLDKHRQNMLTKHMIEKYTSRDMRSVKSRKSRKPRKSARFGNLFGRNKTKLTDELFHENEQLKITQNNNKILDELKKKGEKTRIKRCSNLPKIDQKKCQDILKEIRDPSQYLNLFGKVSSSKFKLLNDLKNANVKL
jgi:hypothetical protein